MSKHFDTLTFVHNTNLLTQYNRVLAQPFYARNAQNMRR